MNDFEGLLSSDYGFKPQGKSAPMASQKPNIPLSNSNSAFDFDIGGTKTTSSSSSPLFDDHDTLFRPNNRQKNPKDDFSDLGEFGDAFSRAHSKSTGGTNSSSSVNLDSIFGGDSGSRFSSLPVFDRPLYDEDVSSSAKYENIFSSSSSSTAKKVDNSDAFDDLLGGLGKRETRSGGPRSKGAEKGIDAFDELLPGFGGSTSSTNRTSSDAAEKPSHVVDDPFVVLESTSQPATSSSGIFSDPLEEIGNLNNSGRSHVETSSRGELFDEVDPLDGLGKSVPVFGAEMTGREADESSIRTGPRSFGRQTSAGGDESQKSSVRSPERATEKKIHVEDYQKPPESVFDMPSFATDSHNSVPKATSTAHGNASFRESSSRGPASPTADENVGSSDDIWLTVSEVPLFTQPTAAPPPSRPPPPRPPRFSRAESGSYAPKKAGDYSSFTGSASYVQSPGSASGGVRGSFASPIDELEDFAMGTNRSNAEGGADANTGEDFDTNSVAAAAMKEAVDRAEAKFRHARGVRERENAKASKGREALQVEKEEKTAQEAQERAFREHQEKMEREKQQREREEGERRRRDEEERRRIEKEREEKEREKRRMERERELARQAVERAAREARERAAIEARVRAERAAVQKAQAEARERAGRAAVQRVQSEARERAAADAKERAEKSAAEAKERARAEAREREAREKAAAASRANQSKNENDLESFFSMGSRASSAPRHRTGSSDPFETQFQSKPAPEATRTSVNSSSSMRKASSSTNIVDDLSSIFGGPPSAGDFQDVDGETEERRRARLDRHQRTQERAAKALAEKNARDLEAQREQEERHRIAETLDIEIKRWAAGKEGNLRALLSTLQYVLWPECGWQPVSLTDLIVGASVKKAYRKATLCIHPDKVQQKGATLQQKYVSEKVFDLLKEAWNKFNSEELF